MLNTVKENVISSLLWFLLVAIGFPLGSALGGFLTRDTSDVNGTAGLGMIAFLFVVGLFIGLGQWIALNRKLKVVWTWIPATAIGFSLGYTVSYLVIAFVGQDVLNLNDYHGKYYAAYQWVEPLAIHMAAGILTGALQWLALERVELTSPTWMIASGLSFAGSFGLADLIAEFHWVSYAGTGIYLAIVLGSVFALLTAIPAGILISRPKYQVR